MSEYRLEPVSEDSTYLSQHSEKYNIKNYDQERKDEMQGVAQGGKYFIYHYKETSNMKK